MTGLGRRVQQRNHSKSSCIHQPPHDGAAQEFFPSPAMNGNGKSHAAAQSRGNFLRLLQAAHLIANNKLRRKGADRLSNSGSLLLPAENIAAPQIPPGDSFRHGGQFMALVHHRYLDTAPPKTQRETPGQIPQQGGLSASRSPGNQNSFLGINLFQQDCRCPGDFPGDADTQGRNLAANSLALSICCHNAADSRAIPPGGGYKTLFQFLLVGMDRKIAETVKAVFQFLSGQSPVPLRRKAVKPACGRKEKTLLSIKQGHRAACPQTKFLYLCQLFRWQLPEGQGQFFW